MPRAMKLIVGSTSDDGPDFTWHDFEIIPDGTVEMYDGQKVVVDAESARAVIDDFDRRGVQVPIDHDHATLFNPDKGLPAPAVGWIKGLRYEAGRGILASEVEWTAEGARDVHEKRYQYRSPVFVVDKKTNRVTRLHSVALTNKPLTLHASELKAASERLLAEELRTMADEPNEQEGQTGGSAEALAIKLGQVIERFGLDVEASAGAEAVIDALLTKGGGGEKEGEAKGEEVAASMRKIFELSDDAGPEKIVAAAEKAVAKAAQSGELKTMSDRLEVYETRERQRSVDEAIDRWSTSSPPKINPNNEPHVKSLRSMAEREIASTGKLDNFHAFMGTMPAVLPPGGRMSEPDETKGTRREKVIAAAEREYGGREGAIYASLTGWVNGALREAGHGPLSKDEQEKLVAV